MKVSCLAGLAALLAAGAAQAQDVKVNALVELWYTQMMDGNLRNNGLYRGTNPYYDGMIGGRFQENQISIKRAELFLNGKITEDLTWNVMFDPNNSNTPAVPNNVLQEAYVTWAFAKGFTMKVGQYKMPTTYEATIVATRDILFFDRSQLNRVFGDRRDRGVAVSYMYGDAAKFQGKVTVGFANGNADNGSNGKSIEANAQKDAFARFEGSLGTNHKFGFYHRTGVGSLKDSESVPGDATAWGGVGVPATQQIKDNNDKSTLTGFYYAFDNATWHANAEFGTGLLGRKFATLFAPPVAPATLPTMARQHLDQKFQGYALTGAYKVGAHWFVARYDMMNYNSGSQWYNATSPYVTATADFSPEYTEMTLGYNYHFVPTKTSLGKLKLDYIMRSKNFMTARVDQTGEQGGDSFVASLMVAF